MLIAPSIPDLRVAIARPWNKVAGQAELSAHRRSRSFIMSTGQQTASRHFSPQVGYVLAVLVRQLDYL